MAACTTGEKYMKCVIFANGDLPEPIALNPPWNKADLFIATDGGARHCRHLRLTPHLLIGDMDSISPELLDHFVSLGSEIHRFPGRKDKTDLELAIELAIGRGVNNILIVGAFGGRWDMTITSIMLLANPDSADIVLSLRDGSTDFHRVRAGGELTIHGDPGDTVSLIPLTEDARGVTLDGLEYPLINENIQVGSTRGISNLFTGKQAAISLREGLLLVVHARKSPG
jgi:thiamine pyrophosphokinase